MDSEPSIPQATEITSLDQSPIGSKVAARQEFFATWYRAIALVLFALVLFVVLKIFGGSANRFSLVLVGATLVWTFIVLAYTIYLRFALKCPRCNLRFGSGSKCGWCNLPRHLPDQAPFGSP